MNRGAILVRRRIPLPYDALEYATPERFDWYYNRRLLELIGNIRSADAEAA